MFQRFDDVSEKSHSGERIAAFRKQLAVRKLDGAIVPHADEFQNEYLPDCARRLAWLTGFTGSAGMAILLADKAVIFVDGRYTLQVRDQVDTGMFEVKHLTEEPPAEWLGKTLVPGARIGFDPRLHSIQAAKKLRQACSEAGAELVPVGDNIVDAIWKERPPPPAEPVTIHALEHAGEASPAKIARLRKQLASAGADALVVTRAENAAWLFNIRGRDVDHTPLPLSRAIVPREGQPELFIAAEKLSSTVRTYLEDLAAIRAPEALEDALAGLRAAGQKVILDPESASAWFAQALGEGETTLLSRTDPITAMKAKKNATEIAGARAAQRRDGAAVTRFLAWLDCHAAAGGVDEISAAIKLEEFRTATGELQDISFDTISGAGPNGAIVHYRVTHASNRPLEPGSLYLVDSGGQYRDGTTDITRTVAIGEPTAEMRSRFTLVLKGHIAIAMARFPENTDGAQLDAFARRALWQAGLDYDHGTGHGVGSFLSVHEGPARISKLPSAKLEPGMILSNEPGYYKTGAYGIRIENLVLVGEPEEVPGGERPMLSFETLTLAPIDTRLVDAGLLSPDEMAWLNAYHARVITELTPLLDADDRTWLEQATRPQQ